MLLVDSKQEAVHWVGVDVSKATFDAGLVRDAQRYPHTPLGAVPARQFTRTVVGVRALVEWLDSLVESADAVRVCMEATGAYSTQLAQWLLAERPLVLAGT